MADYATAASELKARLNAKATRAANLDAFFEELRSSIYAEVEKANSALTQEGLPHVEFHRGYPQGSKIELGLAESNSTISMNDLDGDTPSVVAVMTGEKSEKTVTYLLELGESPLAARRVSLAPANEAKLGPSEIAAVFVEELIVGAP